MIEIKQKSQSELFNLYFNGRLLSDAEVWKSHQSKSNFDIKISLNESNKDLLELDSSNFESINKITVFGIFAWLDARFFDSYVDIDFYKTLQDIENKLISVEFIYAIQPKSADWSLPFSINSYVGKFVDTWEKKSSNFCDIETFSEPYDISLTINYPSYTFRESIINEIKNAELLIKECHKNTISLLTNDSKDFFLISFDFPDGIKAPCEQYLLYFGQFLKDLGISATSNLKEEAGKVLFSVAPTDDIEALDKIREALAVYLNLPSSPVLYNDSFQSMQLKQQVENLQHSQRMKEMEMRSAQYALRLAQQNIENQDKIIIQQNSFIDNQNKIIEKITSKSIMIDSLENKEELEKFCEGFEIGKSEFLIKHFGLYLNPATILKNAGRKILGKEERKSILGLDEETSQENKDQ